MREGLIEIDGARGERGGQILRTSLALSMITGRPIALHRIRAGRAKPGLQRQHLACVSAAAQLCGTIVRNASVGSTVLEFTPVRISDGCRVAGISVGRERAPATGTLARGISVGRERAPPT